MSMTTYNNFTVFKTTKDINALGAGSSVDTDLVLPYKFVVDGGWAHIAAGTTNNSIDIGISGGDVDAFVDGSDNSSGATKELFIATATGVTPSTDAGSTVAIKNAGAAAIPSSETLVTITVVGHYEYS